MRRRTERELLHEVIRNQRMLAYALRNMNYETSRIVAATMQSTMDRAEKVLADEEVHY